MKNKSFSLRYWVNLFAVTLLSLALAFFILAVYASNRWVQSTVHPVRIIPAGDSLVEHKIPYQDIELTTQDGIKLAAWYTSPQPTLNGVEGNGVVILVAHGYNGNRPENIYAMLAQHGYGVLAWDFRAHGQSGGETCSLGDYEQLDVEAALDYVLKQSDVKHIGAWGGSMGAATILLTAAKRPEIEAVVSDSAFPSLEDVMRLNTPIKIMQPFVLFIGNWSSGTHIDQVRPVDEIAKISPRPVFIIDGWEDAAVAMNSPYRLFDAAKDPKQLWVEDGVPHLGMYGNNPKKYERQVTGFFDEYLK
jgi:fermentation-respiration switch protein FrsA (DUF1100 family)